MTEDELVKKLHDMREYGCSLGRYETAMMLVFGLVFDDEIEASGSNASRLARDYKAKYGASIGQGEDIADERKLKRFVTVNADELRRWHSDGA